MKKKLVLAGFLGFTLLFGCSQIENEMSADSPKQFKKVSSEDGFDVVIHIDTGCYYAKSNYSHNRGTLTQMLNRDGSPYCKGE